MFVAGFCKYLTNKKNIKMLGNLDNPVSFKKYSVF